MSQKHAEFSDDWVNRDVRDESYDYESAKKQFLSKVKHDLRTPLNHIIGYSEILMEEAEDHEERLPLTFVQDVQKIHLSGKQLLSFINDLFDPLKPNPLGLAATKHHLRCQLNSIMGFSEILLEDLSSIHPEVFVPDLQKIHSASKHLIGLIDTMPDLWGAPLSLADLAGASKEAGNLAPVIQTEQVPHSERESYLRREQADYHILIVDDNEENRNMLSRRLEHLGYGVKQAEHGLEALEKLYQENFDLVLLDVMMPVMDGHETLKRIKSDQNLRQIPVIMISALDDISLVTHCIEIGAEDYLPKPFDPAILKARVSASIDKKRLNDLEAAHRKLLSEYNQQLEQQVKEQVKEISIAQLGMIFALSKLTESRDPETGEHLERLSEYSKILSNQLAKIPQYSNHLSEAYIENLSIASVLHDIGKVGVPDHILQKNGKLTDAEFEIIKTHTVMGAKTLREVDQRHPGNQFIRIGIEIAESHHEKWNGTGYPNGLKAEEIPLSARIIALADVYDALRSQRCYKPTMPHAEAREIIIRSKSLHFDPIIVEAFLTVEDEIDAAWHKFSDINPEKY